MKQGSVVVKQEEHDSGNMLEAIGGDNVVEIDLIPWALSQGETGEEWDVQAEREAPILTTQQSDRPFEQWVERINMVRDTGLYNHQSSRIPVPTNINIPFLHEFLIDYEDKDIVKFLEFGWPIERDSNVKLQHGDRNHKGATEFADDIDKYIQKELALGAMIGPFNSIHSRNQLPFHH